jgi:hypothetical protein
VKEDFDNKDWLFTFLARKVRKKCFNSIKKPFLPSREMAFETPRDVTPRGAHFTSPFYSTSNFIELKMELKTA